MSAPDGGSKGKTGGEWFGLLTGLGIGGYLFLMFLGLGIAAFFEPFERYRNSILLLAAVGMIASAFIPKKGGAAAH